MKRALFALAISLLASCAALGKVVSITDPQTGEVVESTVGDVLADAVSNVGKTASNLAGGIASTATGNPVVGAGLGALVLSLAGGLAGRLRPKKKT
tara:strand:- start:160 stop:447 length:288 start_codon:yes stop_codon:yes gene_type:complete